MTPRKWCALEADTLRMVSNFISRRPAPKFRPDRNQMVIGKLSSTQARLHSRPAAARASAWVAVWCKKAKSRSAPQIAISKAAWAIAMRTSIWLRPRSWPPAPWPDLFVRQQILLNDPRALRSDAPKRNQGRQHRCRLWKDFPPACAVVFCSSTKTT